MNSPLSFFPPVAQAAPLPAAAILPGSAVTAARAFEALVQSEWTWRLAQFPRLATQAGDHRHDHRLERMDAVSRGERLARWRATRQALRAIDPALLPAPLRMDHAVYANQIETLLGELEHGGALMPMDGDSSFFSLLPDMAREMPLHNAEQVRNYLSRLEAIPRYFDDHMELLTEARERGMLVPAQVLQGREQPLVNMLALGGATRTPFYEPFRRLPASIGSWEAAALCGDAQRVIEHQVLPAYQRLLDHLRHDYLPNARRSLAARELPGGEAFYAQRVRAFTTLPVSAQEVHETGLAEVERIGGEMRQLMRECGFGGELPAFVAQLRQDPVHYPRSAEELLARAAWICKRVDAVLPRFFGKLPRQPFGVAPVPDDIAPFYTSGRYVPASADGDQAALYWVNTCQLSARPWFVLPALTLHEAVPGHHLQMALAAEHRSLPAFRRMDFLSVYGEGWALYAEFLGTEMGIYQTPLEAFGRASYEMMRACRLVVDTGLHMRGWSRQQACDYMLAHTAMSPHEVGTEVDRYIGWPGQALSYKVGELAMRGLRERSERILGAGFDLRAFHDQVLALGSVPLPALEQEVLHWAAGQARGGDARGGM